MFFFILWIVLAVLVGVFADKVMNRSYSWTLFAIIISPLLAFLILLITGKKVKVLEGKELIIKERRELLKELADREALLKAGIIDKSEVEKVKDKLKNNVSREKKIEEKTKESNTREEFLDSLRVKRNIIQKDYKYRSYIRQLYNEGNLTLKEFNRLSME